ncbi:MAG TPA: hypothetical protein DCK95_09745 [Anaerolineaceae bacterium]|nr:hypothetical protein [Anaerolineaceae bacterium]
MRKPLILTIISIVCLTIISVACSYPFYEDNDDEVVIPTLAPQATAVVVEEQAVSTSTAVPTAVNVVLVDWDGQWTIWMGNSSKGYVVDFLVQGDKISGITVVANHNSISFIGTIQQDGGTVKGIWENTDGTSGEFSMHMDESEDVFSGRLSSSSAFCGRRTGNIKPSTCFE